MSSFLAITAGFAGFAVMKATESEYGEAVRQWDRDTSIFGNLLVQELLATEPLYDAASLAVERKNEERTRRWFRW